MFAKIYSKKFLTFIRIISIFAILFLVFRCIQEVSGYFYIEEADSITDNKLIAFLNIPNIVMFIFLAIFPSKIILVAIGAFYNAILIIPFGPMNVMGILMFCLGITVLSFRGFFNTHKKIKIISLIVFYVVMDLTLIRFGLDIYFTAFTYKIGIILVLGLGYVFFELSFADKIINKLTSPENKKLNLADYNGLNKRDAQWLKRIQQNDKYQAIAIDEKLSLGSVKNRLAFIYRTLETGDRVGFMNCYGDYKIYYEEKTEPVDEQNSQDNL